MGLSKKNLGQFVSFRFKYTNRMRIYSGFLIDFNDDWILLKYNPTDYVMDGYIILKSKHVTQYKRNEDEKFTERILKLKGVKVTPKEKISITNIESILTFLNDKYGVFQFDMRTDTSCWLGKIKWIKGSDLKLHALTTRAKWSNTMPIFKLGNIRTIQFDNDYINSLKLGASKK